MVERTVESAAEPAAEPAAESTAERSTAERSVAERSVAEGMTEPVAESVAEGMAEPVAESDGWCTCCKWSGLPTSWSIGLAPCVASFVSFIATFCLE